MYFRLLQSMWENVLAGIVLTIPFVAIILNSDFLTTLATRWIPHIENARPSSVRISTGGVCYGHRTRAAIRTSLKEQLSLSVWHVRTSFEVLRQSDFNALDPAAK